MEDKKLEDYRNERIRSICSIIENRRNEVACKIYLVLTEEPQGTNKLSQPAMNFLFGRKYVDFMDRKNRLQQSADVAKYIRRNNLLSKTDELLAKKYPSLSSVRRVVLAINEVFEEPRRIRNRLNITRPSENERS